MNKMVGIIVPQYANDYELATFNLFLKKAGFYVTLISLTKQLIIQMQSMNKIVCNELIEKCNLSKFNFLILISSQNLTLQKIIKTSFILTQSQKIPKLNKFLNDFFNLKEDNKYLIAINDAPLYLNELNLLKDFKFTCNNTLNKKLGKNCLCDKNIVQDCCLITANDSICALKIVEIITNTMCENKQK
ncbi:hypothetical protein [Ureaplasma urealyticum]|uniref:DJ-1/PfpI domain-containing protein n=5 Tax=Ureaplasma urealyticum TaxID=2130 RepID=A0AAX1R0A6_UREUR|nr:hypothetical protein [Ureaplasma urealyticum]EDX53949.1 conserved hypothetical protein [Ureaplasma urealyticum serovar 9 str. ATCC 33175]ACI59808.1 conserved hypothetical protein [Ureaplasma urealyticum serovar 10 str. ATCC 33699]EDU66902.1 conserved hypothetical protein [Ureaplasma urealyticum serovar 11 str. ATCC 33695]EDX52992.1 conserved hypothetical protein [Ureaplasma urealyticum serovar 12 str. ATCC 33696]EDY74533.1 conserved hypothetical protein [Ureaplasma urealyticum serovar 4 str